jgi:hypothetical protein
MINGRRERMDSFSKLVSKSEERRIHLWDHSWTSLQHRHPNLLASIRQSPTSHSGCATSATLTLKETENTSQVQLAFGGNSTLKAEIIWTFRNVKHHKSYNSNTEIQEDFQMMFQDSKIAWTFTCGEKKTSYLSKFGLAPYIKEQLRRTVSFSALTKV